MDKKRSVLNVTISIISKIVILIFAIVVRRLLIDNAGNDANGVFSLYTNIIGFLAIAELGVGTAISFSMYKPIINGDNAKVSALYNLFKKVYLIVGCVIFVAGFALMPALPYLAKDYAGSFSLYLTFAIMLVDVVLTYTYGSKTSLINAYKNNYVTTFFRLIKTVFCNVIQIIVLVATKSFELYLVARVVSTLLAWLLTTLYTKKHYKEIISTKEVVDAETKKEVVKNTKAMFMHKIGTLLINTTDGIIISAFLGVVVLGFYSNYLVIVTSMAALLKLFFTPLTSTIGHLCAEEDVAKSKKYFSFLYLFNFTIGIVFFLGYYAIIDNLVALFFGEDLLMHFTVPLIITINEFIQFMRITTLVFRDATGTFYYDRWRPVIEGVVNVVLSIALVFICGVVGVLVATIITKILIGHIVEPLVLYNHVFKQKPTKYYLLNYSLIAVFVACVAALHFLKISLENIFLEILVNGFIAVGIALVPLILMFAFSKTYRENTIKLFKKIIEFIKKMFKGKSAK